MMDWATKEARKLLRLTDGSWDDERVPDIAAALRAAENRGVLLTAARTTTEDKGKAGDSHEADRQTAIERLLGMLETPWTPIAGCLLCEVDGSCTKQCASSRVSFARAVAEDWR